MAKEKISATGFFVEDNCFALDLALKKGRAGEAYNIGGGWEKKNIEVVELICDILAEELGRSVEEFKKAHHHCER